jgi:CheY-like chemotaxis protein
VFANLLSNAAKYTDPGGRIRVTGAIDGTAATVTVADNGVGISEDMLPRVFDLFAQERQAIDRSQGGLGLGLAIVRSLVDAHGGDVSARSGGKGTGSEFTVRLPLAVAAAGLPDQPPAPVDEVDAQFARILIVDDNADAAELLAESLRTLGHTTYVAYDGPSAIEAAQLFLPDVALLDLGLPVMDGFELAQRLRADQNFASIRLVAVTGYGTDADRQRTRKAGFDAHMVKPIDIERLDAFIRAGCSTAEV